MPFHRVAALLFLVLTIILGVSTLLLLSDDLDPGVRGGGAPCAAASGSAPQPAEPPCAVEPAQAAVCRLLHLSMLVRTTRVPLAAMLACLGGAYLLVMFNVRRALAIGQTRQYAQASAPHGAGPPGAGGAAAGPQEPPAAPGAEPPLAGNAGSSGTASLARLQHTLSRWGPHTARIVIESLEHDIYELSEALRRADAGQIGQLAHRIEGAVATLEVLPAKAACEAIRECIEYEWPHHAFALTMPLIGILRSTAADAAVLPPAAAQPSGGPK